MIEPEAVVHVLCPEAEVDVDGGITHPLMTLRAALNDSVGHKLTYVCPRCQTEIAVYFPPQDGL